MCSLKSATNNVTRNHSHTLEIHENRVTRQGSRTVMVVLCPSARQAPRGQPKRLTLIYHYLYDKMVSSTSQSRICGLSVDSVKQSECHCRNYKSGNHKDTNVARITSVVSAPHITAKIKTGGRTPYFRDHPQIQTCECSIYPGKTFSINFMKINPRLLKNLSNRQNKAQN